MNIGMMWFNDNPKIPLLDKIHEAVDYYQAKYGCKPNLCLVHVDAYETALPELAKSEPERMTIRPLRSILPGHLWIGMDEVK